MSIQSLSDASAADARILIVDDEVPNVRLLERLLSRAGYSHLFSTTEPRSVLPLLEECRPDLILLDLRMPHIDGLSLLGTIASTVPPDDFMPILVLTADVSDEARERALSRGAMDFLTKPLQNTEVLLRIRNLLATRWLHRRLRQHNCELEERVRERTRELESARVEVLERLIKAAEFRDDVTGLHTRRVGELAGRIAAALGLPEADVQLISRAAPLHDLGKIAIPDSVLLKPGRLTEEEYEVMKSHTLHGASLLSGGRSELIRLAETIALCHHERWDGRGYPRGLRGEAIPLPARIVALADFHDALSHDRPYRSAWSRERVAEEIRSEAGRHFDPRVVTAFESIADGPR